jgi:hypothetical protein
LLCAAPWTLVCSFESCHGFGAFTEHPGSSGNKFWSHLTRPMFLSEYLKYREICQNPQKSSFFPSPFCWCKLDIFADGLIILLQCFRRAENTS